MAVWAHIVEAIEAQSACVLVSVIATRGSAPREAGARMVVRPDGGFHGTIGGGRLEWQAQALTQKLFAAKPRHGFLTRDHVLGPELGQCCGGRVTLAFEVISKDRLIAARALAERETEGCFATRSLPRGDAPLERLVADPDEMGTASVVYENGVLLERFGVARTPLYLFGAGHVARALVLALAPLPFAVTWIDPRADAFPTHAPGNVTCRHESDPAGVLADAPTGAFVLVMTHSHTLDQDIVHTALGANRFGYVGLIGSDTKRARFVSRMRATGLDENALAALICPIGIAGIRSKEPAMLAAATVAELLVRREALADVCSKPMPVQRLADAR